MPTIRWSPQLAHRLRHDAHATRHQTWTHAQNQTQEQAQLRTQQPSPTQDSTDLLEPQDRFTPSSELGRGDQRLGSPALAAIGSSMALMVLGPILGKIGDRLADLIFGPRNPETRPETLPSSESVYSS